MKASPVAITSVGVVTALGVGTETLFSGLLAGRRAIAPIDAFSVAGCRVTLAAEVKTPVPPVGSCRTVGLASLALADALGGLPGLGDLARVGLVFGSAGAGTARLERQLTEEAIAPAFLRDYERRRLVDELADEWGLTGPRHAINTACSSGAVAVAIACDWLEQGDCDVAIAIGSDELGRFTFTGFHALRAMDPMPCRPFDRQRRGLSMGEGAGCLILERSESAARRGCRIRGYVHSVGLACDAHHLTAPDPEGVGPSRALFSAMQIAGVTPGEIGFINAHGTGTPLNDAAEVKAIGLALGDRALTCPVHSVKASIGHCMGAAGAIEAIVTLCSLEQGLVPHTAGLSEPEFEGQIASVIGEPLRVTADFALSHSFGFGGNNAAIVLGAAKSAGQRSQGLLP